jgi:hypothetical protein
VLKQKCEEAQGCKCGRPMVVVVLREKIGGTCREGSVWFQRSVCAFKVKVLRFGSNGAIGVEKHMNI